MDSNMDMFEKFKDAHPELSGRLGNIGSEKKFEESFNTEEKFEEKNKGDFAKIISIAISLAKQYGVLPEKITQNEIDDFIKIASLALDLSFYQEIYQDIKEKKFKRTEEIANRIADFIICKVYAIGKVLIDNVSNIGVEIVREWILFHIGIDLNEQIEYIGRLINVKIKEVTIYKLDTLAEKTKYKVHSCFESLRSSEKKKEHGISEVENEFA